MEFDMPPGNPGNKTSWSRWMVGDPIGPISKRREKKIIFIMHCAPPHTRTRSTLCTGWSKYRVTVIIYVKLKTGACDSHRLLIVKFWSPCGNRYVQIGRESHFINNDQNQRRTCIIIILFYLCTYIYVYIIWKRILCT